MGDASALRGMAWDHPRALNPLRVVSQQWAAGRDVNIQWDARPLKAFEDQPLEELTASYDLILIDHPFVGVAARSGLLRPVDDWVDKDYLNDQKKNSVGPSFESYTWDGRQWALAIDAACQVSAVREDLWKRSGTEAIPRTWEDVRQLAKSLGGTASRVAIPLTPNHAYCAFLSIGVANAGSDFWPQGQPINAEPAIESLEFLRDLPPHLHQASGDADPIGISDLMAEGAQILYVPLMFGYSSYSRAGFATHRIRFGDAPFGQSGRRGSILGGVGLALSAQTNAPELAADLARMIASAPVQQATYVASGGQPGHLAAWKSRLANELTLGFFDNTIATMDDTFIRPRTPGHRRFQEDAGVLIHSCVWLDERSAAECINLLNEAVEKLL